MYITGTAIATPDLLSGSHSVGRINKKIKINNNNKIPLYAYVYAYKYIRTGLN